MDESRIVSACQDNPWLKTFGGSFAEDPFMELDYRFSFETVGSLSELKQLLARGNYAIRQGFVYQNLAFVNQVNGGDEWHVLKEFEDGEILGFESISFKLVIERGGFEELIERLLRATKEQCRTLSY